MRCKGLPAAPVFGLMLFVAAADAAPVTTNTALPVAEGTFIWRSQFIQRARSDDGPLDRDVTVRAWANVLGYGLSGDFAIFGVLPWFIDRELDVTTPDGRVSRVTDGPGDIEVFARYTALKRDWRGRTLRVAPLLGVKAPTGDDDDRDELGRLPRPLQTGTGTWDFFAGVVTTYQTLEWQFDAQVMYRNHGTDEGFSPGAEARLDASLQYRFWPRRLAAGTPGFIYGVLESNLVHRRADQVQGSRDPDSGGTQWLLAPGLQYVGRRWIVEAALQFPVSGNPRGNAVQDDYILRGGLRFIF